MDQIHKDKLHFVLDTLKEHMDDPNWLSQALVTLSTYLIHTSAEIAQNQFQENAAALSFMDSVGEKKVSVAEAEKRAVAQTFNSYKQSLLEREGIVETINSIKKRLDFLSYEYKNTP